MKRKSDFSTQFTPAQNGLVVPSGHLICHPRWRNSEIVNKLSSKAHVSFMGQIGVSDFHPSSNCSVIYITENDLLTSNNYKRRIAKLSNALGFPQKHVLIDKTDLTEENFLALQEFVVMDCGMSILPVENIQQVSDFLTHMVNDAMKTSNRNPFVLPRQCVTCPDAAILAFVQKFPRVGNTKAQLLLQQFRSIKGIAEASKQELSKVCGSSNAQQLLQFLTGS